VVRGGSWNNDNPENLRVAHRNNNNPGNRNNNVGFRVGAPAPQHSLSGSYKLQTRVLDFTESRSVFVPLPLDSNGRDYPDHLNLRCGVEGVQINLPALSSFISLGRRCEERSAPPVTRNSLNVDERDGRFF